MPYLGCRSRLGARVDLEMEKFALPTMNIWNEVESLKPVEELQSAEASAHADLLRTSNSNQIKTPKTSLLEHSRGFFGRQILRQTVHSDIL